MRPALSYTAADSVFLYTPSLTLIPRRVCLPVFSVCLFVKTCSPYSYTEHRVPELIPVFGSQPAGDVSHKHGGRLLLLSVSARPAVTLATLKKAATNFAAW